MKKKQTKLSLADILTQLTATEDGVVEFERSEISVVDDRYFKMPYFFDQAKVICLCGYDGVRDYFGIRITEEKVRKFALKNYPSAEEVEQEIKVGIKGVQLVEIEIEHLSGKKVHER